MHRLSVSVDLFLDQRVVSDLEVGGRRREDGEDVVRGRQSLSAGGRLHRRDRFVALAEVGQRTRKLKKNQDRVSRTAGGSTFKCYSANSSYLCLKEM